MASNTPRGVQYPTELDKIKDGSSPSALADDFRDLAATTDAAIADGVAEAVADAATKYGGLPSRVTAVEQKNVQQDQAISDVSDRVQTLLDTTQALDAPKGFDANTVNGQAVHAVNTVDSPVNMPGDGSWMLFTWPQLGAQQQQLALKFDIAGPEMHARVRTGEGWGSWNRLDANKWAERLDVIEAASASQDSRLDTLESENDEQERQLTSILDQLTHLEPIDAPAGFDANSVTDQRLHMVDSADGAAHMPDTGSWLLWSIPQQGETAMQQVALRYSANAPQLLSRVKTSTGWGAWNRLDADKWAERLNEIEAKNSEQDQRLDGLENLRPVKSVRLENGKWVWAPENATHYVLIDHNGKPTVRATPWPMPKPSTPTFSW